ncbi:hypothetical protein [Streptomyces canus]|nr:hypothetical protein [Streptomyces canus]
MTEVYCFEFEACGVAQTEAARLRACIDRAAVELAAAMRSQRR